MAMMCRLIAGVHQLVGQNEERHRQQRKAVHPGDQVLRRELRAAAVPLTQANGARQH
jgi:hypothetical protein